MEKNQNVDDNGSAWLKRLLVFGLIFGVAFAGTIVASGIIVCARGGGQMQDFACVEPEMIGVCLAADGNMYVVPYGPTVNLSDGYSDYLIDSGRGTVIG